MNAPLIRIGVVVRDFHQRVGIVCSRETTPSQAWIKEQLRVEEIEKLGATEWWGVMPLNGGYVLEAEPLLTYLREATYDDFLTAADATTTVDARRKLLKIFPQFLNRLLAERHSSEK